MFSRLKDALDRTIAEEQARHKAATGHKDNTGTDVNVPADKPKSSAQADAANPDGTSLHGPNPDPAVFEAAFTLKDEASGDNQAGAPEPAAAVKKDGDNGSTNTKKKDLTQPQDNDVSGAANADTAEKPADSASAPPKQPPQDDLSPDVRAKLRRLARLEPTYLELLRSYRIAHARIMPFERALQEHTPLDSIKDPSAFVEYINEVNSRSDMISQELKRVSVEKDDYKKKYEELEKTLEERDEKKLDELEKKVEKFRLAYEESERNLAATRSKQAEEKDESVSVVSHAEDLKKLQAELDAKTEVIEKLTTELDTANKIIATRSDSTTADEDSGQAIDDNDDGDNDFGDATTVGELDAMTTELGFLKGDLMAKEKVIKEMVADLAQTTSQLTAMQSEKEILSSKVIEQRRHTSERIASMEKTIENYRKAAAAKTTGPQTVPATGKKNKNKNKKKKGGALEPKAESVAGEVSEPEGAPEGPDTAALRADIDSRLQEIAAKDAEIEKLTKEKEELTKEKEELTKEKEELTKQKRDKDELLEEIDHLREQLVDIAEATVTAKSSVKELEAEKKTLTERVIKADIALSVAAHREKSMNQKIEKYEETMEKELKELKVKSRARESELGAANSLAQDRFKEIKKREELLAKAQADMKSLLKDSTALKSTREELASTQANVRGLEKQLTALKAELTSVQRLVATRDSEITSLAGRLSAEKTNLAKAEDEKRVSGRGWRRAEAEKVEMAAKAERTDRELAVAQAELTELRPKVKKLEEEAAVLGKANNVAKEDVDLKTQQYNNAQNLLASMRDQMAELSMQRKEAQTKAEGLEEELAESQRHLAERTRDTEAMRRMLTQQGDEAETRVREMRSRIEAATEERDRIEEESLTVARRLTREVEESKNKLRDLEREVKALGLERDDLQAREKEWRRRREELEQVEEKATAEMEAMQSTVSGLRSALDVSEQQVRDAEKREAHVKKLLNDAKAQADKANKDLLEATRSRTRTAGSPHASAGGRTSAESTRSLSGGNGADLAYTKMLFLRFLEVKDEKVRMQLIPVLGRVLGFDKQEQQRGVAALEYLQKQGR